MRGRVIVQEISPTQDLENTNQEERRAEVAQLLFQAGRVTLLGIRSRARLGQHSGAPSLFLWICHKPFVTALEQLT